DGFPVELTVAAAENVSHTAEQLPPLPGTRSAWTCGARLAVSASAARELNRVSLILGLLRRRALRAPELLRSMERLSADVEQYTRNEFGVTGILRSRQQ